jgi:hypothetical protein
MIIELSGEMGRVIEVAQKAGVDMEQLTKPPWEANA